MPPRVLWTPSGERRWKGFYGSETLGMVPTLAAQTGGWSHSRSKTLIIYFLCQLWEFIKSLLELKVQYLKEVWDYY